MRKTGRKTVQHDTTRQPRGCAPHGSTTSQVDTTPQRNRRRRKTGATAPTTTPTPRPRPAWPKTNPPPPNHQNTPQAPLFGGRPKRGPKRQSDTRAPPTPDPARDLGFPPDNPSGEQETPASTTPSRSMRRPQASPLSVLASRQDRAFAQRRVPRPRARQQGPAQTTTCSR